MSSNEFYAVDSLSLSPSYLEEAREVFKSLNYLSPVKYKNASRYKNLRTIQDDKSGKIYHESWYQKFVDKSADDQYFIVTKLEENRLDMISTYYYDTPRYWWVIALANYLLDPFDVPVGKQLRIPPLLALYNEGGVLSGR